MKLLFEEWYKKNLEQEIVDTYYEGSCIDVDMLTMIENFARKAFEAGYELGISYD